ncbi:MAG: hypothetical protein HYZ71_09680 [Deltaproteobacteria bacterium]|nr:hypothetical protein [Deltaproteobacteria bacterium]
MERKRLTHDTAPATVGLVKEVRGELKAEIRSLKKEMTAKIEAVLVGVHRTQALMEEQRGENRIVLDGLSTMLDRQDRLEGDVESLKRHTGV